MSYPQPPDQPGPEYRHTSPGWPPQQPQQPFQPQYMPPAKERRGPLFWMLAIAGGAFGLCASIGIIGALTGGDDTKTPATNAGAAPGAKPEAAKAPAEKTAGIGDKVRDGKFEFVVTGMDCSKTKIGSQYLNTRAQGKFCIVSVSVTNIGDEAQMFTGAEQLAYAGKTEFKNDSEAELYANEDSQTFLEEINPGNSVKGKLIFDVPKATKLTEIELHDSFLSGGIRVSLT